ncbi:MAG: FtsQ-type POTRA domain-containing protein [bacterium]
MVRRRRRIKQKPRPKRSRLWSFLFVLIVAAGLVAYILSLPVWQINNVVVNGAQMLSADEIRSLAGVPLSENLFYTSLKRSRNNLEKISAIKKIHFFRIPPGTVLINIEERQPIATIVFSQKSVVIDEAGYILNQNPSISFNVPNLADLPVISGLGEGQALSEGKVSPKVAEIVAEIVVKLARFLGAERIQLQLGNLQNINFLLDDLLRVKIGDDQQMKKKMQVFEALLPQVAGKWSNVAYIDVRFPDNPVIKFK